MGKKLFVLLFLFIFSFSGIGGEEKIRVVSLSPAITEILCQLGAEKSLVGRSASCDYPERIKKLPVAGDFARPDMEKILLLKPHYLFSNDLINPLVAKNLEALGVKTVMKQSSTIEDYFYWVEKIGKYLKKEKEATEEILRVKKHFAEMQKKVAKLKKRKKVLWIIWDSPIMAAGKNSLPHHLLHYAGAVNAAGEIKSDYFKCSPEWVAKINPEIIVFLNLSRKKKRELALRYPWNALTAWKKDCIITRIDESLLLRPGPRLTEGLTLLHKYLYP